MAQKTKLYLSKSKAGDVVYTNQIRKHLQSLDCELLEFTGGTYSSDLLQSSEFLIVVPPEGMTKREGGPGFWVGKGQYEEIRVAENHSISQYIAVYENAIDRLRIDEVYKITVVSANWQTKYAFIELYDMPNTVEDELDLEPLSIFPINELEEKLVELSNLSPFVNTSAYNTVDVCIVPSDNGSVYYRDGTASLNWTPPTINAITLPRKKARLACITLL